MKRSVLLILPLSLAVSLAVVLLTSGALPAAALTTFGNITTVAGGGDSLGDGGLATSASLYWPVGVALGADSSLYIADSQNNRVRRVGPDGIISTVAGDGSCCSSGDGSPATRASVGDPFGVAIGPDGSLYIASQAGGRIRRVGPDGIINTVAGNGSWAFSGDGGPATAAALKDPVGVALGADGSIYIADWQNSRIRRVGPDGIISTVAGNGICCFSGDGGPATEASVGYPTGVALGADGSLYIDAGGRIRRVGPDGIISTVAGNGICCFSGDGGPALEASLDVPWGVAIGADGSLYIPGYDNQRIRRVGPDGIISTVAGNGIGGFSGDGGPALEASLKRPSGVAVGADGSLYIADQLNNRIRRVSPAATATETPTATTTPTSTPSDTATATNTPTATAMPTSTPSDTATATNTPTATAMPTSTPTETATATSTPTATAPPASTPSPTPTATMRPVCVPTPPGGGGSMWLQEFPTGAPPAPRYALGYAYDEANDRLMTFSGNKGVPYPQDTWVLSNASGVSGTPAWTQLLSTGGPPPGRCCTSAVYDAATNRLIIHGGCSDQCGTALADAWVLTNANGTGGTPQWLRLPAAPVGRQSHLAAYDPASNRMIIFGGAGNSPGSDYNDVWILTNANGMGGTPTWSQLAPTGTLPAPRGGYSSFGSYDPATNRLMVFGGQTSTQVFYNDVWVLSNANGLGGTPQWTQLAPTGTPPTPRASHSTNYDPATNRLIVFGGSTLDSPVYAALNEVWVLSNANGLGGTPQWTQLGTIDKLVSQRSGVVLARCRETICPVLDGG